MVFWRTIGSAVINYNSTQYNLLYQKGGPKSNFFKSALEKQDMAISQPRSQKWNRNNGTFFSPTLKFQEYKISLSFSILARDKAIFWHSIPKEEKISIFNLLFRMKIWPYLSLRAKIDKTKGTKFSWIIWLYVFNFWLLGQDINIFLFWREELKNHAFCSKFGLRLWSFRGTF